MSDKPVTKAFGIKLHQHPDYPRGYFEGEKNGFRLTVQIFREEWQKSGGWVATATVGLITIRPDLTSSSMRAAICNLRGHLQNLAISLDRAGIRGWPKKLKRKAKT